MGESPVPSAELEAKPPPLLGGRGEGGVAGRARASEAEADWICGGCRASWPRQPDLWKSASRLAEPTGSLPSDRLAARRQHSVGLESRAWEWIACWATYQAWLASIRTKSVRTDALDLTLLRAFHNARPCPTLSRLRTQCAEPHLRIGPRSTEDPQSIPSSRRTFASEASIAKLTKPESAACSPAGRAPPCARQSSVWRLEHRMLPAWRDRSSGLASGCRPPIAVVRSDLRAEPSPHLRRPRQVPLPWRRFRPRVCPKPNRGLSQSIQCCHAGVRVRAYAA